MLIDPRRANPAAGFLTDGERDLAGAADALSKGRAATEAAHLAGLPTHRI
jgi:hypothetical protein